MPKFQLYKSVDIGKGRCPVCGGKIRPTLLSADLNTNTLSYRGLRWKATPKVIEFLHVLIEAYPKPVPQFTLMTALYGHDAERKSFGLLKQYAWHINVMLLPVDLRVHNIPNVSFRLGSNSEESFDGLRRRDARSHATGHRVSGAKRNKRDV